jgi:hypothetical protein
MSFNKIKELRNKYDEILDLVIENLDDSKRIEGFKESYTDDVLNTIINKFCKVLENDSKTFNLIVNRKAKVFASVNGLFIIPSVNLKPILSKSNSSYLWECIQIIYAINRTGDDTQKDKVQQIIESIEKFNLEGNEQNNNSSDDDDENAVMDTTIENKPKNKVDNIVMDIADTLRDNMVSASKGSQKVNPIENMIKTSQMISEKYGSKLKSGQISMNDMFESLGRMMGEIDKKTSNDDELKNVDIDDMPNPEDIMSELGVDMKGFNPMDMISQMLDKKKEEKDLTPEQVKEMEDFYANIKSEDLKIDDNVESLEQLNGNLMNKLPDDKKSQLMDFTKKFMSTLNKN